MFLLPAVPQELKFRLEDAKNIFIGYFKPKPQDEKSEKDFLKVVIETFCDPANSQKSFEQIFEIVCEQFPPDSIGIVKSSDFKLDLSKKDGNNYFCLVFIISCLYKTNQK